MKYGFDVTEITLECRGMPVQVQRTRTPVEDIDWPLAWSMAHDTRDVNVTRVAVRELGVLEA